MNDLKDMQDLIGIGIGPFNLSLAALLENAPHVKSLFLERKSDFNWHPEVMFSDSAMQTSYLKDLVTPVDPTSPYSFLNYLVHHQLFYAFSNTQRSVVSRREFEQYCKWVAQKLAAKLKFDSDVQSVQFNGENFQIETSNGAYRAQNICVATGLVPRIPDFAKNLVSPQVFHAKSPQLKNLDLNGKSVLIVGGGQTGIEVFRNAILGQWGHAKEINLVTRRKTLEPLDESAFTNEYFSPQYVSSFWPLKNEKKAQIVASQKLASDGNTPAYLSLLYNDLYRVKHVERDQRPIRILACRKLVEIQKTNDYYNATIENSFTEQTEHIKADIVILSTGFESVIPKPLEPLFSRMNLDTEGRFQFKKSYAIQWDGPANNKIYALNFSRHNHGIIDPQTSLMAWRSAVVINDLTQSNLYATDHAFQNFVDYGTLQSTTTEQLS